jgi:ParB family chromosome partitioning protein
VTPLQIREIPLAALRAAPWNPNEADAATLQRLAASLGQFGPVLPLVVRAQADGFEVLGGNQRLRLYRDQGRATVPCVTVVADDVQARLLAQALNAIHGEDDLTKKAALVRTLLDTMTADAIARLLPDSAEALRGLAALGQPESGALAESLSAWAQAEAAKAATRLHVTSFPLTAAQKAAIEAAVDQALTLPVVARYDGPNKRAAALAHIAQEWTAGRGYRAGRGRPDGAPPIVSAAATPQNAEA